MRFAVALFLIVFSSYAYGAEVQSAQFKKYLKGVSESHPQFASARMTALAKRASALQNILRPTPSLSVTGSKVIEEWSATEGESGEIAVNLNLFRFGGNVAAVQLGRKTARQADLDIRLSELDIQKAAAEILFQWLEVSKRLQNQKFLVESRKELVRVARERYSRGQLAAQEVEKVKLDASNAEVEIRQAEVLLLELKSQLDVYLSGATDIQLWPWKELAQKPFKKEPKSVSERLGFQRRELETDIRRHQAWAATADWLPRLDLTSTWETDNISPVRDGEWTSLLTLTIPIWDRGASLSQRRYWKNLEVAAAADLRLFELEEKAKNSSLLERREKLRLNVLQALQASEKSETLAKDSLRRFQLGRASVNDLLLDQDRVYNANVLTQQALRQYHLVLLEACLAADLLPAECF